MKRKLLTFGTAALFLIGASFITSCGDSQNADNQEEHEHMDGEEHDDMDHDKMDMDHDKMDMDETKMENMENTDQTAAVYACPMHPEVTGKEGENCSKCGMSLEKTEKEDHSDHDHE